MTTPSPPPVPLPVHVNLETSLACNLACVMCAPYLTGSTRKRDRMSKELLERVEASLLANAAFVALTVAGEPFADRSWPQYVDLAERTGTRLVIHNNGTRLPPDEALLRLLRVTRVLEFSVDAVDPTTFARIRGRDALATICENIARVVRLRATLPRRHQPRLGITMVLMRQNIEQLPAMVDLAADLGVDAVGAVHLTVFREELDAESLRHSPALSDAQFAAAQQRAQQRGISLNLPPWMDGRPVTAPTWKHHIQHLFAIPAHTGRGWLRQTARVVRNRLQVRHWENKTGGRVGCNYLMHRVYVSVGGDVTPCCMPGRPIAGNLYEQDFASIWNGPVYTALREGLRGGKPLPCCAHCSVNRAEGYVPSDPDTARPPDQQLESSRLRREEVGSASLPES